MNETNTNENSTAPASLVECLVMWENTKRLFDLVFRKKIVCSNVLIGAYQDVDRGNFIYSLLMSKKPKKLKNGEPAHVYKHKKSKSHYLKLIFNSPESVSVIINQLQILKKEMEKEA